MFKNLPYLKVSIKHKMKTVYEAASIFNTQFNNILLIYIKIASKEGCILSKFLQISMRHVGKRF